MGRDFNVTNQAFSEAIQKTSPTAFIKISDEIPIRPERKFARRMTVKANNYSLNKKSCFKITATSAIYVFICFSCIRLEIVNYLQTILMILLQGEGNT